jgi:predicted ATPase
MDRFPQDVEDSASGPKSANPMGTTLSRVSVENFLSLQKMDLDLSPLNVLVGPNGGGKTNILKTFQFLGDVARLDLVPAIYEFGGFENLLFRGKDSKQRTIRIHFTGVVTPYASTNAPDEYSLSFWQRQYPSPDPNVPARRVVQRLEDIVLKRTAGRGRRIKLSGRSAIVERIGGPVRRRMPNPLSVQAAATGLATLRRLGEDYEASQVELLAKVFEELRLFEINVDRIRRPTVTRDAHKLRPDAANLAAFLQWLRSAYTDAFERICDDVRFVLPGFEGFEFIPLGGPDEAVRLDIRERNLKGTTPLGRVSFGTIRSIALFAMLHDPEPPKLTCLEEIDHGLHPHALDRLVDRLREASESTQILLATHSPALVNRLSPDELIVVERDQSGASTIVKPSREKVEELQAKTGYGLGELWFSGALGGGL